MSQKKSQQVLKLKRSIKEGFFDFAHFGPAVSLARVNWIMSGCTVESAMKRNRTLVKYLSKKYGYLIDRYRDYHNPLENSRETEADAPVWFFWWQGKDAMPEIIRFCYDRMIHAAGNHPVILLSQENVEQYVRFPDFVWEQFRQKKLRIQHLADMIRVQLIRNYGGIWLDASIYCLRDIPETAFLYDIFSLSFTPSYENVSECRWTTFAIGGHKGNLLFSFLDDFFIDYCRSGKPFVDYFMFDCAIAVAYENFPEVKNAIDKLERTEKAVYWLTGHLCDDCDSVIHELAEQNAFQKLSWGNYLEKSIPENSLYRYLQQRDKQHG